MPPTVAPSVAERHPSPTPSPPGAARSDPARAPLVVIFMENHERSSVVGSPSAPYQNEMLRRGRDYANYYGVTHPSLPNYLAFASGSTVGKADDEIAAGEVPGTTLWDQLSAARIDWAVYEESMPSRCYGEPAAGSAPGDYALKHNPALPFRNVFRDSAKCANVQPLSEMDASDLPSFSFVTPNECSDGHSCPMTTADRWLAERVPPLVAAGADVVVTYDEGTTDAGPNGSSAGGHVFAAEIGPDVPHGAVFRQPLDHYSLLAGIEERFGLPRLGAAARATPMPT